MKVSWFVGFLALAVLPFTACRIQEHRSRERRAPNSDDLCQSRPCQNNGVCSETRNNISCACADGYSGKFCEKNNRASLSKKEAIILLVFVIIFIAIIFLVLFMLRLQILGVCKIRRRFRSSPADESSGRQTAVLEEEGKRKIRKRVDHEDPEHLGKSSRNQELSALPVKEPAGQGIPQTKDHYQELNRLVPAEPKYGTLSPETRQDTEGNSGGGRLSEQNTSQPYNPYQEIKSLTPAEPKYGTLSPDTRDAGSKAGEGLANNPYQEITTLTPTEPKYGSLSPETRESGNASVD